MAGLEKEVSGIERDLELEPGDLEISTTPVRGMKVGVGRCRTYYRKGRKEGSKVKA